MVLIPKKQFMWLILFNKIENLCLATGHEKELECTHIIMYIQMTIILQPVFKLKKTYTLQQKNVQSSPKNETEDNNDETWHWAKTFRSANKT